LLVSKRPKNVNETSRDWSNVRQDKLDKSGQQMVNGSGDKQILEQLWTANKMDKYFFSSNQIVLVTNFEVNKINLKNK